MSPSAGPHPRPGRVGLISGGTRGIGAAVAAHLLRQGWQLSLGVRPSSTLDGLKAEGEVQTVSFDAAQANEAEWVEAARSRFGRIDAVVACAGVMVPQSVVEIDDAKLDLMWEVNVKSPHRLVSAAWTDLCASGEGRVVILSSLSGKRVKSASSGAYAMTKHAATALCHGIRQAGWGKGIRATAVCPGFVDTDMARAITGYPPDRMTRPGDVARMVAMALDMPNSASMAEMAVSCQLEESF